MARRRGADGGPTVEERLVAGRRPRTGTVPAGALPSSGPSGTSPASPAPAAPTAAPVPPAAPMGPLWADRFELGAELGAGSMGVVHAAFDTARGHEVALKRLHPGLATEAALRGGLMALSAVAAVVHPRIARPLDHGEHDGTPWVSSVLVDGTALDQVIAAAPMPLPRAVRLAAQAATALAVGHAAGIAHQDFKSANCLVDRREALSVVDFGLPRVQLSGHSGHPDGLLFGTPEYLAPERLREVGRPGPEADLWALGVVLYELFTGLTPFGAPTVGEVFQRIVHDRPPTPCRFRPELPPQLGDLTLRLLQREPARRGADAQGASLVLQHFEALLRDG